MSTAKICKKGVLDAVRKHPELNISDLAKHVSKECKVGELIVKTPLLELDKSTVRPLHPTLQQVEELGRKLLYYVVYKGKIIGVVDVNDGFHIVRPEPKKNVRLKIPLKTFKIDSSNLLPQ